MKKLILSIVALLCMNVGSNAQSVYNEIRDKAKAEVENSDSNGLIRQINQFKLDALDYLMMKMREQMPDSTTAFLDRQAYAMNSFVNHFIKNILESNDKPEKQQIEMIKQFMDASYSNPLFNDTDTELTLSYYSNATSPTRFSLDTDWRKALVAIESRQQ
mgnify:FL=1